jgi:rSAM/selenodomain-associated transferase 2
LSFEACPELSVIVPVLDEARNIAPFLRGISLQREVRMELIVSDGGSSDDTVEAVSTLGLGLEFPVRVITGAKGRAGQMNLAARAACSPTLLFLHIDSSFPDPRSFRKALDALAAADPRGTAKVAGRFSLQFDFDHRPPLAYRFYGAKATLDRPGCTHGDQGLLIGEQFFRELCGFPEQLPFMEDTLLAERVRKEGRWLLLPARIKTSPRRFLTEGLLPRQTLNAMLMNLVAIGELELIAALKDCYRSQQTTGRLQLGPMLAALSRRIAQLPLAARMRLWYATGSYARSNAWQIPFFFDLLLGGVSEGKGGKLLAFHDRFLQRLIDNKAGNCAAAALSRICFDLARLAWRN